MNIVPGSVNFNANGLPYSDKPLDDTGDLLDMNNSVVGNLNYDTGTFTISPKNYAIDLSYFHDDDASWSPNLLSRIAINDFMLRAIAH